MPLPPEGLDPDHFGLTEFFEAFHPIELFSDDVFAVMDPKPIVKGSLSPRPGYFDVLPEANLDRLGRKSYVPIGDFRPEPDPVDHASGRKFGGQDSFPLSATSCHNMQLTQFSTSVPCSAI
jgi:hypothetical protein